MRKSVRLFAFLVAGLLLAGGVTMADEEYINVDRVITLMSDHPSGIVKFARKLNVGDCPVPPMPEPVEPAATLSRDALTGPVAMSDGDFSAGMGGVLLAPRGAALSSPRQVADREIRKLIRRLD